MHPSQNEHRNENGTSDGRAILLGIDQRQKAGAANKVLMSVKVSSTKSKNHQKGKRATGWLVKHLFVQHH